MCKETTASVHPGQLDRSHGARLSAQDNADTVTSLVNVLENESMYYADVL